MKQIINTDKAPRAIGPYSQAVKTDSQKLLFLSGQVSFDPKTMELVGNTAAEQCRQVMDNLGAVLNADGADYSNIVKCTIYLTDMNDFAAVNEVYAGYFQTDPPARACFQVARLPKDAKVEIEAIAAI